MNYCEESCSEARALCVYGRDIEDDCRQKIEQYSRVFSIGAGEIGTRCGRQTIPPRFSHRREGDWLCASEIGGFKK